MRGVAERGLDDVAQKRGSPRRAVRSALVEPHLETLGEGRGHRPDDSIRCGRPSGLPIGGPRPFRYNQKLSGDVAQLGEHLVRNEGVGGSNPLVSTNYSMGRARV